MNISEVARRAGLPVKTVRYYEEIGLVTAARSANGYRAYRPRDLHRLAFVGRARSLGFSIGECRALLQLYDDPGRASADVKALAEAHLAQIDAKLGELAAMRATLADLVTACAGDRRPDCPILTAIAPAHPPLDPTAHSG
jgi:Cu(I)-responsive transcriptional regulator